VARGGSGGYVTVLRLLVRMGHLPTCRAARMWYPSAMQELPPILVAEDDDDDFHLLRRAIRETGVENPVLRFRDGAELVAFLDQIPAAELGATANATWLLLLDLGMPIVNGFEVLKWLGTRKGLPRLRTIVLSGFYYPADIERTATLGAVDYYVKPIGAQDLAEILSTQLAPAARVER
jgi:CheY-like chemotaxis protein